MKTRYWVALILTILAISGSFTIVALVNPQALSTWADVTMALTAVAASYYAIYQYLSSRKVQRQEKSAEIMRTYASHLVHRVSLVYQIFEGNPILSTITNKIDRKAKLRFTNDELSNFPITTHDKKEYFDYLYDNQLRTLKRRDGLVYIDLLPKDIADNLPEHQNVATFIAFTLNELETVCMEIESGAADTNYLYGSLHQTFLPFVRNAAMLIQKLNNRSLDDENYYPYVSRVYRRWVSRENSNHTMTEKALQKNEKKHDRSSKRL
ncbi:hypothetical protein KI440_02765 [Candidatus Saccharibacteria bacterium TM7i]|nr:hypothetical protein KI440_02765 [Candidatus Saccharibacteria bacterium TM7i]